MSAEPPGMPPIPEMPKVPDQYHMTEQDISPGFKKFFGEDVTKEHVMQFMNNWLKMVITDIKKGEKKWKENMEKMKRGDY